MRFKSALVLLSFSALTLLPLTALADTLTFTGTAGGSTDGIAVYPYQFTITGPGGTTSLFDLSCLNFNREITSGESWTVDAYNVLDIPTSALGGFTEQQYLADALLSNEYTAAAGNSTLTSEIQFAIWSIMDPTGINSTSVYNNTGAFDSTASSLAANALAEVATAPNSTYADDIVFIPDQSNEAGWTDGTPQIFMANSVPKAITPEPASLVLLSTGLLGTISVVSRKLRKT